MKPSIVDPIAAALREDIGDGDLTTDFFVSKNQQAIARIVVRERAIVAGAETAAEVFRRVDSDLKIEIVRKDGSEVHPGEPVIEIRGPAHSILKAERVAEKAAVVAGGGANHRFGLFDMVLLKDNHLAMNAGFDAFAKTVRRFREAKPNVQIEVEADALEQVRAFLEIDGIDVILLDNMKPAQIREAIALGKDKVKFEASGGVTLKNIRQIAATGVDYISIGALTHSARAIDFSLELTPLPA